MRLFTAALAFAMMAFAILAGPIAMAGDTDPLFINLTTDDPHRANMALTFAAKQQQRKHPVTVFLNDKAVFIGAKSQAEKFKEQQAAIAGLLQGGANIIICPMCMKHFGVAETDVIEGAKVGNPELTGGLLFKDNTKSLTW